MVQTPTKPTIKSTAPTVDREQGQQQLELLGYKPGDNVYLTAFFPKGDPRTKGGNRDKGRKSDRLNYTEVEKWQAEGRGVYLVVNGYGHAKDDVKNCRAIFYEHDDLEKELQLNLWQSLGLPEPTVQIDTGGKSIHSYWVFKEPIHPELWAFDEGKGNWKGLQADLLKFANADTSLVNPNRVMRLAGCWYMVNDESGTHAVAQSRIVGGCGKRYSYAELREIIPRNETLLETKRSHRNDYQDTGEGLLDFRTVGHLLPEWNDRGRRGWATFQCPVHTSSGKHSDDHIHVNLTDGAWTAHCGCDRKLIYQTICEMVGHSPKPTGRGYGGGNRRNFGGGSGGSGGDGGDGGNNGDDQVSLYERIKEIINRQLPDPVQVEALIRLAQDEGVNRSDVEAIARELLIKNERTADLKEDSSQFKKLVSFREQELNLGKIFPLHLAKALQSKADSSRLDPIRLVQNMLPACGAVLGADVCVIAKHGATERDHWYEYPIFWTGDFSPPSSGKSDAQRSCFEPLKEMEKEELKRVNEAKKELSLIKARWQNLTDEEKEEKQDTDADPAFFESEYVDKVRRYIWDEATIESLFKLISEQPEKAGTAWIKDELEGLFKSLDQHKSGGKGNALQQLLSAWGSPLWGTVDRVDKAKSFRLSGQTLNISGTSQPGVITKRLNVRDDPDGLASRLLMAMSKLPDDFSSWSDVQVSLFDCIKGLLTGLEQMRGVCEFSPQSQKRWVSRWEELRRGYQYYLESNPGYAYFLGKQCSYVPRLALLLHCIEHYYQPKESFPQIGLETLERAIALSDYYCGQFRLLQASSFSQDEFPLEGLLFKVWEKVKALGKMATRDVSQFARRYKWHGKKVTAGAALEILEAIHKAGYGVLKEKTLYFTSPDSPPTPPSGVDHVDRMLINDQQGQPKVEYGIQEFVDHVDQTPGSFFEVTPSEVAADKESSFFTGDQHDQQMAVTLDNQSLETVGWRSTSDQHDQQQWGEVATQAIAPAPVLPVADATPSPSPLPQKTSIEVVESTADTTAVEDAIAPTSPIENEPQAAEVVTSEQTPQPITAKAIAVIADPEERWAWSVQTGECLGRVLWEEHGEVKVRQSGQPSHRAKNYPLREVTFENPVVDALSINVSPSANQWESQDFLEELDD
jgi:hypothetical protein